MEKSSLKLRTAHSFKWNTIDKISTQLIYAISGIVLANNVSKADFGIVGIILVFQAFASLFVDSGFSSALIQRHAPDSKDYSTVFFFNLAMSIGIYIILFFASPLIAGFFGYEELTPLSRVMFLTFVLNALAIVQTNRLMKQMTVRLIAISNFIALAVSGTLGIVLAVKGYGAWALVWQSVSLSGLKALILWLCVKWRPTLYFSFRRLKSFFSVGAGVMTTSFLNTVSQNIYPLIIGTTLNMVSLGLYTQAEKWSKMGIMSLSQTLTSTFLPLLSEINTERERFLRGIAKTNRLCSYIVFPVFILLALIATPLFHILFGNKWDEAIPLFQILVVRGIFNVLILHYNNYILAIGKSKLLVSSEFVKDAVMIAALAVTVPYGLEAIVWGQFAASIACWLYTLWLTAKALEIPIYTLVVQALPYVGITVIAMIPAFYMLSVQANAYITITGQIISAVIIYMVINAILKSKIQSDILSYIFHRI